MTEEETAARPDRTLTFGLSSLGLLLLALLAASSPYLSLALFAATLVVIAWGFARIPGLPRPLTARQLGGIVMLAFAALFALVIVVAVLAFRSVA